MTIADTLRHLGLSAPDPRPDGELVRQFARVRDEAAFAELLRRHGPVVYGVCRRVVGNATDADDAFQAVFLTLARKAGVLSDPNAVGGWLYGVAVRTAHGARAMNARRVSRHERAGGLEDLPERAVGLPDRDTLVAIDAELAALPEHYRAAFVTCEVNGRSRSEAARELGWPEGTVATRLAKARELLASRLGKRGIALAVGVGAVMTVPAAVASETFAAVRELLAVGTASAVAPAAQQLSDEVVRAMSTTSAKWVTVVGVLALTLAVGGAVLLASEPGEKHPPLREPIKAPVPKSPPSEWREGQPIQFDRHPHGDRVTGLAYSPDGKFLAVAIGNQVRLLDAATREQVNEHDLTAKVPAAVTGVAFSPKGDRLAMTARDHVFIYDDLGKSPSASTDRSWKIEGLDPSQVVWLGEDSVVASNGEEVRWKLPDVKQDIVWKVPEGKTQRPVVMAAIPGQTRLFVTQGDNKRDKNELEVAAAPPSSSPQTRLPGHKVRPVAAAVTKDGQRIVTADEGGTLIVWEGEKFAYKEKSRVELSEGVAQLALAPDGKTVAVLRAFVDTELLGQSGRTVTTLYLYVFEVTDPPAKPEPQWTNRGQLLLGEKKADGPFSLAFSPDGKTLLAAFADPYIPDNPKQRGLVPKPMGVRVWERAPKK